MLEHYIIYRVRDEASTKADEEEDPRRPLLEH